MTVKYCFLLVVISQIFIVNNAKSQGYETKYDDIDLDELLKNDRLRHNYIKCLLSEGILTPNINKTRQKFNNKKKHLGPCSPDGQELKVALPDAIQSECSKCSEKQKSGADQVTHFLIDNKPDEWQKLADKYDKNGEYKEKYLKEKKSTEETDTKDSKEED